MDIAGIRTEYRQQSLLEENVEKAPVQQFEKWWKEAIHSGIHEVNDMTLATA
jgi:pyridoxamine 5'-phosphate oxidase